MKKILALTLLTYSGLSYANPGTIAIVEESQKSFAYTPKDYSYLLGMQGFSDELLKMHFELYQGYVKNTNMLLKKLGSWDLSDKSSLYEYTALKRRLGWEWDGMRLHEFYFGNLGGKDKMEKVSALYHGLVKDFGSFERWKSDFIATGLTRGIGWVILYRDPESGKLMNTWIEEHDLGHLAGGAPLLVMDVFEHAYITEYGLDRAKYIDAFFDNIHWAVAMGRYDAALNPNWLPIHAESASETKMYKLSDKTKVATLARRETQ